MPHIPLSAAGMTQAFAQGGFEGMLEWQAAQWKSQHPDPPPPAAAPPRRPRGTPPPDIRTPPPDIRVRPPRGQAPGGSTGGMFGGKPAIAPAPVVTPRSIAEIGLASQDPNFVDSPWSRAVRLRLRGPMRVPDLPPPAAAPPPIPYPAPPALPPEIIPGRPTPWVGSDRPPTLDTPIDIVTDPVGSDFGPLIAPVVPVRKQTIAQRFESGDPSLYRQGTGGSGPSVVPGGPLTVRSSILDTDLVRDVFLPLDVWLNEATGGVPGETISARVAPGSTVIDRVIRGGLDTVDPGHTDRAFYNRSANMLPRVPKGHAAVIARNYRCK